MKENVSGCFFLNTVYIQIDTGHHCAEIIFVVECQSWCRSGVSAISYQREHESSKIVMCLTSSLCIQVSQCLLCVGWYMLGLLTGGLTRLFSTSRSLMIVETRTVCT